MHIDQADASAVQVVALNEEENLVIASLVHTGKCMEKRDDFFPISQIAACDLANYERVSTALFSIQQSHKTLVGSAEVIHPDGNGTYLRPFGDGLACLFSRWARPDF